MIFTKIIEELKSKFSHSALLFNEVNGELTITVADDHLLDVCAHLKNDPSLQFNQLIDVCGVDYSTYGQADYVPRQADYVPRQADYVPRQADYVPRQTDNVSNVSNNNESSFTKRYAAVYHLLSMPHNMRIRLRSFAHDDDEPQLPSVVGLWAGANWFEREAYDLYGIKFYAHPDLRRILTDYGFEDYPMRKDFPLHGRTEVVYDEAQDKVISKPTSYKFRKVVPRVIRK